MKNFNPQNTRDTNRQSPGGSFDPPIQYSFGIPSQSNTTRARKKKGFKEVMKMSNYPYLQKIWLYT
jgi:hypothetical protein